MRKNITLLAIAILGMVAFFSCKKSDNNNANNINVNGSMTATIGTTAFKAPYCDATVYDTLFTVTGSTSDTGITYPYIILSVTDYKGIGTYTIPGGSDRNGNVATVYYTDSTGAQSVYGTVSITAITPNIVGTFSFTCSDSTKVTNGTFSAPSPL